MEKYDEQVRPLNTGDTYNNYLPTGDG